MQTINATQASFLYRQAEKAFREGAFQAGAEILSSIPEGTRIIPTPPPRKAPVRSGITDDEMYRPRTSPHFRPRF